MLFMQRRKAPEPEDLRCEYRTSEVHIANLSSGVWQSAAIVVGGSIAAFAFLIDAASTHLVAAAVTVLAVGAVVVIEMWRHNWTRHKRSIENHWARMREIEARRGMRTNICMYLLTRGKGERLALPEWEFLSEDEQKCFPKPYDEFPEPRCKVAPRTGQGVLQATACLAQLGWLLMIAFAWIEAVR